MFKQTLWAAVLMTASLSSVQAQDLLHAKEGKAEKVHVTFDGQNTYQETKFVRPSFVKVSSTLSSESNRYQKKYLNDRKPKTAWVEGVKGDGVGETITFGLKGMPSMIGIVPGYMASESVWNKNNRVKKLEMTFYLDDGKVFDKFTVDFPTDGYGKVPMKHYEVDICSRYPFDMRTMDVEKVVVKILEVDDYKAKYDDTCISELNFYEY